MIKVEYAGQFYLGLKKLVKKHPELRIPIQQRVKLFRSNPNDTRLANHVLHKRLTGKWSFSVADDIRIVYSFRGKNTALFLVIGTHEEVYRRK